MAALAGDPFAPPWRAVLARLRPAPGRWGFTLRIALICATTAAAVATYGTPDAALTIYLAFFLNRADRMASVAASITMLLLMSFIIAFSMIAAIVVVNSPVWRVAAIGVISFGLLFLTSASKLRPVGSTVALIVGYALDLLGTISVGEEATRALLYVWLFVAFPAAASIIVDLLIAPAPRHLLQKALAGRLMLAADLLAGPTPARRAALERTLRGGDAALNEHLRMIGLERTASSTIIAALGQAVRSSTVVLELVDLLTREDDRLEPAAGVAFAQPLRGMASIFAKGGYPVEIASVTADGACIGGTIACELDKTLMGFALADARDLPLPAARTGFFEPDAFTNKEHVLFALRMTMAALFCYFLYTMLNWPGIHTCFLTCYIVALSTAAESIEKLMLRIGGCLVGAALGYAALLLVVPSITSVGGLMIVVFVGTAIAAWVVAGGPFVAYAGFQLAFAFLLCVVQGAGPAFDLTVARDRVIGILIGNLVSYVAMTRLWPSSVTARVDHAIARLVSVLADATRKPAIAAAAVAAVGSGVGAVVRDLELAAYEPETLGRGSVWQASRWRLVQAVDRLAAPVLLATRTAMPDLEKVGRELDALAQDIRGQIPAGGDQADPPLQPLRNAMTTLKNEVDAVRRQEGNARAAA